jgi:pimeloyl-ACP methyl ester carboxylesterase
VPDAPLRGPAAPGILVWAHGKAGQADQRTLPMAAFTRRFAQAGFDLVRFNRDPFADATARATAWLRDSLRVLRARGYTRIVAAGQSRGAWNALALIDTPTLADAVIALSPAAQGSGASMALSGQIDDLRTLVADAPASSLRLAVAQFANDPFDADADARTRLLERLRPRLGALLLIDRPPGLEGHSAGMSGAFDARFGETVLKFVLGRAARGAQPPP